MKRNYRKKIMALASGFHLREDVLPLDRLVQRYAQRQATGLLYSGRRLEGSHPLGELDLRFLGWCYESFLCSLYKYGHFINRGFLFGPCCPIYGTGAMLCWLLFWSVNDLPLLFLLSALSFSAVEYPTGWALGVGLELGVGAIDSNMKMCENNIICCSY